MGCIVRETKLEIDKAPDLPVANAEIAALLERLNDSHTFFIPPRNANKVNYGWRAKVFGNRCYVTDVRAGSDAESKGMRPGDQVLTINGFSVDRASTQRLNYAMKVLIPRRMLHLELRDPAGKLLHLDVASAVKKHKVIAGLGSEDWDLWDRENESEKAWSRESAKYKEVEPDLMVLKIPGFLQTGSDVNGLFKKAREHKTLIVDLRGTPGGLEASLQSYLADIFDHDVKIGNLLSRDKTASWTIKSNRHDLFSGKLIVLVDRETVSSGEIFVRVVQMNIEARFWATIAPA